MTQQAELIREIDRIPQKYFSEVISFLGYLQHKAQQEQQAQNNNAVEQPQGRRGYGSLKGQIWMADDFDAPLDDFKDYM